MLRSIGYELLKINKQELISVSLHDDEKCKQLTIFMNEKHLLIYISVHKLVRSVLIVKKKKV